MLGPLSWLWATAFLLSVAPAHSFAVQATDSESFQGYSTPQLWQRIEEASGDEKLQAQLALLRRFDATIEQRDRTANELIERHRDSGNSAILAAAYSARGRVEGDRGNFDSALEILETGAEFAKQDPSNAQLLFRILCNKAVFSNVVGKRDQAIMLIGEALELAAGDEWSFEVPFAYSVLAHVAEGAGAIEKAYENFRTAFDCATRTGKTDLAGQAGINIVELAISEGNAKLATEYITALEELTQKVSDPRVRFLAELRKQDVRRLNGDSQGSAKELMRMLEQLPEAADRQQRGLLNLSLAASQVSNGEYSQAVETSQVASDLLQPIPRSWTTAQLFRVRAEFGLGHSSQALETVDQLLANDRVAVIHRIELLVLRSTILASLSRFQESLESLTECRNLEDQRDTHRAQELSQFIKFDFENQQRDLELSMAKARAAGAQSKAQLSAMAADQEAAEASWARLTRNVSVLTSIIAVSLVSLYLRLSWNRKVTAAVVQRERELNERLKSELSMQAVELKDQVTKSQNLELAVERKFRDEAIGKLTGGIAHDFNNLLSVILHSAELIRVKSKNELPAELVELLDAINTAAESGTNLVDQLMAYTRQQPLSAKAILVSKWFSLTRNILRQTTGKDVDFRERNDSRDAIIMTDAARLTTAVINLLANARDALTARGNHIEFSIEKVELTKDDLKQWKDLRPGSYCLFQVRDDGIGMSQIEISRACEPFYTTKLPGAGTGLGLSSVLGFVRQSGGDFRMISQINVGTTAEFLIPIADTPVEDEVVATSEPLAMPQAKRSVLLVEDQDPVRKVLSTGLTAMGYQPIVASSADEAIRIVESCGMPEIVLSDVRMPGAMDGLELRKWLINKDPNVRVVLMSGYQEYDLPQDGKVILLAKPVKLSELRRVLAEC